MKAGLPSEIAGCFTTRQTGRIGADDLLDRKTDKLP